MNDAKKEPYEQLCEVVMEQGANLIENLSAFDPQFSQRSLLFRYINAVELAVIELRKELDGTKAALKGLQAHHEQYVRRTRR